MNKVSQSESSFASLWEAVTHRNEKLPRSPLHHEISDTRATTVYNKLPDQFWKQLSDIANADPNGLGELLGIEPADVAKWHGKLKLASSSAKRAKMEKNQDTMIPTGPK